MLIVLYFILTVIFSMIGLICLKKLDKGFLVTVTFSAVLSGIVTAVVGTIKYYTLPDNNLYLSTEVPKIEGINLEKEKISLDNSVVRLKDIDTLRLGNKTEIKIYKIKSIKDLGWFFNYNNEVSRKITLTVSNDSIFKDIYKKRKNLLEKN